MKHGFTLLELSIVLVIIGLIIGGVTAGSALIRSSGLQSIPKEFTKYQVAVNTFKLKYNALPGDMPNATAYWGTADGGDGKGSDCAAIDSTTQVTCNGNGNFKLEDLNMNDFEQMENLNFWKHLANSDIIQGNYTGGRNFVPIPSSNVPNGSLSGSYWAVEGRSSGGPATGGDSSGRKYGNMLIYGSASGANFYPSPSGIITPEELYNIDVKMDDGLPYTGAVNTQVTACYTGSGASAAYKLSDSTVLCSIDFYSAF